MFTWWHQRSLCKCADSCARIWRDCSLKPKIWEVLFCLWIERYLFVMNAFHFPDTGLCQALSIRIVERTPVNVTTFCTQKPQILKAFDLRKVYRSSNVTGIYRLSYTESHICYDVQVLPVISNPAQLNGGKYYEIVNRNWFIRGDDYYFKVRSKQL